MKLKVITGPGSEFMNLMKGRIAATDRPGIEDKRFGAAGLVHGSLLDLYWAADIVEKACSCRLALVQGSCPQHVQLLAFFGKQSEVEAGAGALRAAME
jgi:hypothetical protein